MTMTQERKHGPWRVVRRYSTLPPVPREYAFGFEGACSRLELLSCGHKLIVKNSRPFAERRRCHACRDEGRLE